MTLSTKTGAENVLRSIQHYVTARLPAKVSTLNTANSATLISYLAGPYVFSADTDLVLSLSGGADLTETITAGTYTAAQLAAAISLTGITATTAMDARHLDLHATARGVAGSLKVVSGGSMLGWRDGYVDNYYPARNLAECEIRHSNIEPTAYPALHLRCDDARERADTPEMREYDIAMRLYEASQEVPSGDVLYVGLARMAHLIADLLAPADGSRSMDGQINGLVLSRYSQSPSVESDGRIMFRGYVDFSLTATVQED